jgi:hypothetical protein
MLLALPTYGEFSFTLERERVCAFATEKEKALNVAMSNLPSLVFVTAI